MGDSVETERHLPPHSQTMQSVSLEQSAIMTVAAEEASSPQRSLHSNGSIMHRRQSSSGHDLGHAHSHHQGHKKPVGSQSYHGNHDSHRHQESGGSRSLRRQMRQLEIAPSNRSSLTTEKSFKGQLPMNIVGAASASISTPKGTSASTHRESPRIDPLYNNDPGHNHHQQSKPSRRRSRIDRSWKKEPLPALALSLPLPGQSHFQPHRRHHRQRQAKPLDYRDDALSVSRPRKPRDGVLAEEKGRVAAGSRKEDSSYELGEGFNGNVADDRYHRHYSRLHLKRDGQAAEAYRHFQSEEYGEGSHQSGRRTSSDRRMNQGVGSQALLKDSASVFSTPSPPVMSQLLAMILELTRALWTDSSQVTRLVLSESLLGGEDMHGRSQLLMAVRKIPRLTHFAANTRVASLVPGLLETLLEYHHPHLVSFQLVDYPLQSATVTREEEVHRLNAQTVPSRFPSHPFQAQQHSLDFTATPETSRMNVQEQPTDTMPRLCCRLLECCPNLQLFESNVPLPLEDLIASVPSWSSASILTVLRIEIQEFSGAGALDMEEEMVMQMFVKSLFMGSFYGPEIRPNSRSGSGSDSGMSEVGSESSTSNNSSLCRAMAPLTLHQRIPAFADGSPAFLPSSGSTGSGSGSYHGSNRGFLDGTSSAISMSGSTSGSSGVLNNMTSSSSSSQQESGALYSIWPACSPSPSLMRSQTGDGPGLSHSPGALPSPISLHPQNGHFAVETSLAVPRPAVQQETKESFVGVANFTNISEKMTNSRGAAFHPSELMNGLPSPIPPAPPPSLMGLYSLPLMSSPTTSEVGGLSLEGLKTRPAAMVNNGYSPIESVDRLVALQFLVEHQLVYLPKLDRFSLGNRLYKIPTRR